MNSDKRSTRKPRSNTVEVKLNKPAPASRSKSPRPKSRSQSRSRKSLPSAVKPSSPQRQASPARTRSKKAPSSNLGAKLYTKKDAPAAAEQAPAQREKSPARSPARKSPAKASPAKAASPAKRTTRSASSAAQAAATAASSEALFPTPSASASSSSTSVASYELRRRGAREGNSSPVRSGTVQQAQQRKCGLLSLPCQLCSRLTCPFRNWFGTGYLHCTMASIGHLLAATLLLLVALFVLNRFNLVDLSSCKWLTNLFNRITSFVLDNYNAVARRVGLGN